MTDKSAAAIREFAEKQFPLSKELKKEVLYNQMQQAKQNECLSGLTALISEHYYPKEFTEWVSGTGWQYHMKFKIWTLGMTKATTDELYEVWKENVR